DNHIVIFAGNTPTIPTTFVSVETLTLTPTVVEPTFSPMPGTYTSAQNVTIASATSGATIRYTTNGTTPSETVGTVYTSGTPVAVTSTETINAIAYKSGMRDSAVVPAAYTINLPAPTLTTVSPNSGKQGTNVPVTLTGTNFISGATVAVANTGITVTNVKVVSATQITATFVIGATAALGATNVTVTTSGGTSAAVPFTVTAGAPTLASVTPNAGAQGTSVSVTLAGTYLTGATVAVANTGIAVTNVVVASSTQITATFVIGATAALGATNVTVTTSAGTSAAVPFTVVANVYTHVRPITIDHTKVPNTDQSNFPVLISGVYPFLATTANPNGQVQNANGYDIIFTADYAGTTQLDHEIESYDPATGTINMWVRLPVLSHTCNTVIYVAYGNAAVTTSQENINEV